MFSHKKIFSCFYNALKDTINHDGFEHAGYLAFLALLSLFPFLVFFMALSQAFNHFGISELVTTSVDTHVIGVNITHWFMANIPEDFMAALQPRIQEIVMGPPQNILNLALLGAIWTSSSAVEGIRTILNRAYRVTTPPPYYQRRLMSIFQFILLSMVIIAASIFIVLLPEWWKKIPYLYTQNWAFHVNMLRYAILALFLWIIISILYYFLPNRKHPFPFKIDMIGALVVMALWLAVGKIFYVYLTYFNQISVIYGSLAGIIISMIYFYMVSIVFIFGAELNYHLYKKFYLL